VGAVTITRVPVGEGLSLAAEAVGDGPPVVLVHAGIADTRMWDDVVPALAERHRVVRYDLPGFGQSPLSGEVGDSTRDLEAVLDAFAIDRAALVGASLGGRVALEFTLARPARVTALLLVAPGLRDHEFSAVVRQAGDEEDEAFERGDYAAAAEAMVRVWVIGPRRTAADVDPEIIVRVREMSVRSYELYAEAVAGGGEPQSVQGPDPPASARLGEIAVPTLVLVGDADVPDMLQIADRLEAGIPGARKIVWPDVAHLPPMERPREFERLLLDFLAGAPGD
jgi:pimeloyl-ACP methyl ester carboxylesterase